MEVKNLGIVQKPTEKPQLLPKEKTAEINVQDKVDATAYSPENPAPHKKWTVLSYVAGDNDLEVPMVKTVDAMELAGSDENTHVVAQLDRGSHPDPNIDSGWKHCRRFYITRDEQVNKINSQVMAQYDQTDMADSNVLKDFIVWGIKTFPSDHVFVILNDHGDSFQGAMHDGQKYMSVPKIELAFGEAEKETGKHIDLIGFNACLMANVETAYQLKDKADILLASEEVEYAPGWTIDDQFRPPDKMDEFVSVIGEALKNFQEVMRTDKIDMTPNELAKLIVETNAKHKDVLPTFSAVDLKEMRNVADSIKELGGAIKKTTNKDEVRKAFTSAENYGMGWNPYKHVHDLQQVCKNLLEKTPDEDIKKAAQKVIESTSKSIIANETDEINHPHSTGLNIFAPMRKNTGYEQKYSKLAFQQDTDWLTSLDSVKESMQNKEREI